MHNNIEMIIQKSYLAKMGFTVVKFGYNAESRLVGEKPAAQISDEFHSRSFCIYTAGSVRYHSVEATKTIT